MGNQVDIYNKAEREAASALLKGYFLDHYEALLNNSPFLQMVDIQTGDAWDLALKYLANVAGVSEKTGDRIFHRLKEEAFKIKYKVWDLSYKVSRDDFMNDSLALYEKMFRGMAEEQANFVQERIINALENGNSTTNGVCYDSAAFFGAGHFGSQDNDLTSVAAAATAVPTVAEAQEAIRTCISTMMGFYTESGRPAGYGAGNDIWIVCEPALYTVLRQVMQNESISNSGNELAGTFKLASSGYCTVDATPTTRFYMLDTSKVLKPLVMYEREKISIQSELDGDHFQIINDDYAFTSTSRFEVSYGDWKGAIKYIFTT